MAFAPDLFHGQTATTREGAQALAKSFDAKEPELKAQIAEGAKFLSEKAGGKGIAVVGFSFGAYYALQFSNDEPGLVRSVVVFYGTGAEDFVKWKAAYLGHFAEKNEFEPKAGVDGLEKMLRDAGRPATFYPYPGVVHWFFEPGVKEAYEKAAADLAWERTVQFLRETLNANS